MKIELPTDCGNAPRITIVSDFATAWAGRDLARMSERLAGDFVWRIAGGEEHAGTDAPASAAPPAAADRLVLASVITHGRLAACDGHYESGSSTVEFSHVFRFASTVKTARIAEVRSYLIERSVNS